MKRNAHHHTKMYLLCGSLGVRRYVSVGLLESLWNLAAREAPRGDIGKLSDSEIAVGIDYEKDPATLIQAMVDARWLNRSHRYRLIIHDWHDHADDAVKKYLVRNKMAFASLEQDVETCRDMNRLPEPMPEPEPMPVLPAGHAREKAGNPYNPSPNGTAGMPNSPANPPATTQRAASRLAGADLSIGDWSETSRAILDRFPEAGDAKILAVAAAALGQNPEATDALVAAAVRAKYRKSQKSPSLYLDTVPEWFRQNARQPAAPSESPPPLPASCARCGDRAAIEPDGSMARDWGGGIDTVKVLARGGSLCECEQGKFMEKLFDLERPGWRWGDYESTSQFAAQKKKLSGAVA